MAVRVVGFFWFFAFRALLFSLESLSPWIIFVWVGCCKRVISAYDVFGLFVIISIVISLTKLSLRSILDLISPVNFLSISHDGIFDVAFQTLAQLIFEILFLFSLPK
jgi:hypothetical protein